MTYELLRDITIIKKNLDKNIDALYLVLSELEDLHDGIKELTTDNEILEEQISNLKDENNDLKKGIK